MEPQASPTYIRIAGIADAALLAEMGRRAFFEAYADLNTPENMAAYLAASFSVNQQSQELSQPGSTFLIAEKEKVPVGFVRLLDCPAPDFVQAQHPLELVRIYTLSPWIGQGIGGFMMQHSIQLAEKRGYDALWLSVWTINARAIAFYQKWGFGIAGTATFTVGSDVQDDYIMVRRIRSNPKIIF